MGVLAAHNGMSTQALNYAAVQAGLKDILLNHARLYETLRDQGNQEEEGKKRKVEVGHGRTALN